MRKLLRKKVYFLTPTFQDSEMPQTRTSQRRVISAKEGIMKVLEHVHALNLKFFPNIHVSDNVKDLLPAL